MRAHALLWWLLVVGRIVVIATTRGCSVHNTRNWGVQHAKKVDAGSRRSTLICRLRPSHGKRPDGAMSCQHTQGNTLRCARRFSCSLHHPRKTRLQVQRSPGNHVAQQTLQTIGIIAHTDFKCVQIRSVARHIKNIKKSTRCTAQNSLCAVASHC